VVQRSESVTVIARLAISITEGPVRVAEIEPAEAPVLRLVMLGPPRIERDGSPVHFDTRKAVALLALVSMAEQPLTRDRLATMFWPDSDDERARGALRRTLSVTAAGVGDALVVTRATVAVQKSQVQVDAVEFRRLLGRGDLVALDKACALYRDDFLAGFAVRDCPDFDDWQSSTAADLRQRLSTALEGLVAARTANGELEKALELARRWVALDALHEPAQQATIRLLALTGQRSAALRQYRDCVRALADELGVAPLRETTAIYDDVRSGRVAALTQPTPTPPALAAPAAAEMVVAGAGDDFVGRVQQLATLERAVLSVAPAGRLAALVGETGAGKTRLAGELAARASRSGSNVFVVRAHQGEASLPFAVLTDLLAQLLSRRPELPQLVPPHVALEVSRLVPGFSAASPPPLGALTSAGLTRLYGAVASTLVVAAHADSLRPAVFFVDDVHWADDATLSVLSYLTNRLAELPLRLVLTWAPENASRLGALRATVTDAAADGRAAVVPLEPFGLEEITELLAAVPLAESALPLDARRLLVETRGLPLLVVEYIRAAKSGTVDAPPAGVRDLLERRIDAAQETTVQVVSAAAVLQGRFDADLLRAVSGRSEAETADALDEAVRHRLLEESPATTDGEAPAYDFPFEALRRVVYERTTFARRRLLHGRAADALARRHERTPAAESSAAVPPAVVAHHFEQSGRESEAAAWWWRAATRSRGLYAHDQAYADLSRALALGYSPADVWTSTGDVLVALGRYSEALGAYESAAGLAEAAEFAAGVEHKLAEVHHRLGDWPAADDHLRAAVELLRNTDQHPAPNAPFASGALVARIGSDRALLAYRRGDVAVARELADDALQTAQAVGDMTAAAQALDVLGMVSAAGGDLEAADSLLRRSIEQATDLPDSGVAIAALNNLARVLADRGRPDEALDAAREALRLGTERGDQHRLAALQTNLADLLHAAGDESAALEHLKEAARLFAGVDTGGEPRAEVWTLVEW
jgi:DNA-binding SARP family transcriptional activator/tetratricopeptide (TPR) repeat protein/type II secretory pathway predicted ATPase ExeA